MAPSLHSIPSKTLSLLGEHFLIVLGTKTVFIVIVQSLKWTVWQISQSSTQEVEHSSLQEPEAEEIRSAAITRMQGELGNIFTKII